MKKLLLALTILFFTTPLLAQDNQGGNVYTPAGNPTAPRTITISEGYPLAAFTVVPDFRRAPLPSIDYAAMFFQVVSVTANKLRAYSSLSGSCATNSLGYDIAAGTYKACISGTWTTFATGTALSGLTAGRVPYAATSSTLADNANFVWDNTNSRVGIRQATPLYALDVGLQSRICAVGGCVGAIDSTAYGLSVQNNAAGSWIEILNSGGAGKGGFFGMNSTNMEIYNWQGGPIRLFTSASASAGTERLRINNSGEVGVNKNQTVAQFAVKASAADKVGISVEQFTGQTAPLFRAVDTSIGVLASINFDGTFWQIGGTTTAFPAFKRDAIVIAAKLADDSAGAWFQNTAGEGALASAFTRSDATLTATNLSYNVVAGRSYRITGLLQVSNTVAAEGIQFDFNGGDATATTFFVSTSAVGSVVAGTVVGSTLGTAITYTTTTGTDYIRIDGYLKVNAGGTLILRAAEAATATGTATVGAGSWIALSDTVTK